MSENISRCSIRIAVNLTLNHHRKHAKLRIKSLDADYGGNNSQAKAALKDFLCDGNSPDPAIVAQNKELSEIVFKLLMKLDPGQRSVILLRDIEGMNYAQIAKVLNIELGTVKSRISRARSSLREILDFALCDNAEREARYLSFTK